MPLAPLKNRAKRHESKKTRVVRRIRTIAIAFVILALIIGALLYVFMWVMKPQPVKTPAATDSGLEKMPDLTSHKFGPNVPIGSSIQSVTTPIAPGDNASVTVRTTEGAVCSLRVAHLDPSAKELSHVTDSGIIDKTADEYGMVTWTWTMPLNADIATWKADIYCKRDSKSTQSSAEIVVKRQ